MPHHGTHALWSLRRAAAREWDERHRPPQPVALRQPERVGAHGRTAGRPDSAQRRRRDQATAQAERCARRLLLRPHPRSRTGTGSDLGVSAGGQQSTVEGSFAGCAGGLIPGCTGRSRIQVRRRHGVQQGIPQTNEVLGGGDAEDRAHTVSLASNHAAFHTTHLNSRQEATARPLVAVVHGGRVPEPAVGAAAVKLGTVGHNLVQAVRFLVKGARR